MRAVGLFIRVMRRHHACVERRIGDLGIHHSQHRMLMQLAKREGERPSQKELAEAMGISPAAVTVTLKKLEKEGYICRSMTDEDNRRNEIRITEKGLQKVMESRAVFESTDTEMFAGFSPEEIATVISFMERLDHNLDAAGAPADPIAKAPRERKEM
jgi:DNA-binding MarR family transcriptional regulator